MMIEKADEKITEFFLSTKILEKKLKKTKDMSSLR